MENQLILIAAFGTNGQVGLNNDLPWHIPEELKHFKATTTGVPVIMGRKTFESIGHPLAQRRNIVVSNKVGFLPGAELARSIEQAIQSTRLESRRFVIGGPSVWQASLPSVTHLILSEIAYDGEADAHLPPEFFEQVRKEFRMCHVKHHEQFTVSYWVRHGYAA